MHRAEPPDGLDEATDALAFVTGVLRELDADGNDSAARLLEALVRIRAVRDHLAEWERPGSGRGEQRTIAQTIRLLAQREAAAQRERRTRWSAAVIRVAMAVSAASGSPCWIAVKTA